MASPPASPGTLPARPMSAMVRPAPRSSSRMSMQGKSAGGSRASDEDTKTAVKVVVRVRPPLRPEDPGFELIPQRFQRSMVQVHSPTNLSIESPQGRKLFVFDRVFGPEVGQAGIWEYLDEGVSAFTQGYNVSLLAYGQSGAGKSYTMGTAGDQDELEQMGVIPRAATALFERLEGPKVNPNRSSMSQLRTPARFSNPPVSFTKGADKNWTLRASYVEIYNEQLRDLLVDDTIPLHERGAVTIREDVKGNILLTGLRQVEVNSVDDLMHVLEQGSIVRQTDATAINARSSRSHAVFSLNLVQKKSKPSTGAERRMSMPVEGLSGSESLVTTDSKMHFVDLAGSERLKNTGAQGERAKEGISINAGLAALGKVISQLSSRQAGAHVSYRDSKLTRLLQDSLGGNAITYMIACVTPAEFHLSETLNTVQYAQRARAIQSKPRIQQVEEGDKQAIIDRLKAEVAFLREQIRSAERSGGERRTLAPGERPERQNEREVELQNQLLDAQENYTALNQRHAKLIAELARARDEEQSENLLEKNLGDSATERLNRSNSFAQAVEQVVLEYEKTIQSLEQSLASTRATLSSTEGSLLEKESNCAYAETINNQLQARLQKLMDREANTESYLHDLETKLDGHTSGEEKNTAIIMELRKEIARVRENEAACEDYISTLEERLAEADQDAELMQREIDRLEQVVERQRSLGKLDSLLYELDQIQPTTPAPEAEVGATNGTTNGAGHRRTASRSIADHSRSHSHVSRHSQLEETIPEIGEEDIPEEEDEAVDGQKTTRKLSPLANDGEVLEYPTSPAQSKFVADKLETMNQELLGLRVEHEATLNEYDLLHAKYEEALRALGQLQDMVDEAKHPNRQRDSMLSVASPMLTRPTSFLSDARTYETKDTTHLSMRSLSSELSSALESPSTTLDVSDAGTAVPKSGSIPESPIEPTNGADATTEVRRLKAMAVEKEAAEQELAERYAQLEERHQHALDMVEELKTQVARAQAANEDSSKAGHVIRRKSSQTLMIIDRAHRSFASLRNIAAEHFEDQPDVMQNFELNLNAAMHELHARSERIQELETNVATAKKEMETKMTIISGLTRERSSLKAASPMDMAVVSNLRNQLEQSEMRIKELQQANEVREKELEAQFAELQELIKQTAVNANATAATADTSEEAAAQLAAREEKIAELEKELLGWEERHKSAVQALQDNEEQMKKTISELEAQVASFTAKLSEVKVDEKSEGSNERAVDEAPKQTDGEDKKLVDFLRTEIDEYKILISANQAKVAQAEKQHQEIQQLLEQAIKERDEAAKEAASQKDLVAKLELQISDHEQSIKAHQESVHELQSAHQKDVNEIMLAGRRDLESQLAALKTEHANRTKQLESDLTEAREELMKVATQVAYALGLDVSVEKISDRISDLAGAQKALSEEQGKRLELEQDIVELSNINDTIMRDLEAVRASLAEVLAAESEKQQGPTGQGFPVKEQVALVKKKVVDLEVKNKKNSRLVEELEDQLNKNFDQVQAASNRLSLLQTERNQQLEEANAAKVRLQGELDAIKEEYSALQAKYDGILSNNETDTPQRSNSQSQQNGHGVRKSSSVASLPSPPPAIPLPPLPSNNSGTTSPTPRPPSKDVGGISQIQEDQEARIRLIEKHLKAEKQLTTTLEEALTDLERQQLALRADSDAWRRRAQELEQEIKDLKEKPQQDNRWSLQQVEEERRKRRDAEIARAHLEERMNTISKKKKKGSLNCF
ncbi:putative kinesin-like protein [Cercophora samala]|uniref:Kinesin-like protein n=1 Tax=Cercophora samala TaxID=330535 RepID=A0AA39ZNN8_9PEZI|nr:putative kinesin-like protein [Cercophora samala]